jgi:phosphoribosylanthranilate isomerase
MILVKICGVKSPAAFDATIEAGADFVGFNFFSRSPRHLTPREAAVLSARHAGGPQRVGLFVAPTDDDIAAALAQVALDVLQLYAPADRAAAVRAHFGIPVWQPVGVAAAADLPRTCIVDGLLIEAKPPADATRPGGNAIALDWSLLSGWSAPAPWLLAGGLTAANVEAAVRATNALGVDVSSGVESAPGVKDPALIRAFAATVRAM